MEEIVRVKVAGTSLALSKGAYAVLSHFLENTERAYADSPNKGELVEQTESRIVATLLEKQSASTVVERGVMELIVASVGYPEGYIPTGSPEGVKIPNTTPKPAAPKPAAPKPEVGLLGHIVIVGGKIILGIMLACWILAAIGILVGFVTLMAVGDIWAEYLTMPIEGISPVVFAGLVCAVIVLFMGIVADLGVRLIAGRRISLRKLAVAGVIWLIFVLWLIFASVRNIDNWVIWAHESEAKIEQWERDFEDFEERLEEQLENTIFNPTLVDGSETKLTFYLYELGDTLKLEKLCEEFDELYRYDEYITNFLINDKEVVINVTLSQEDNVIMRKTTITTPSGVTTINVSVERGTGKLLKYNSDITNDISN